MKPMKRIAAGILTLMVICTAAAAPAGKRRDTGGY